MTNAEFKLEYDRSVVGVEYELATVTVTRDQLVAYAVAVGEPNPIYWDEEAARRGPHGGLVALPTFCSIFSFRALNAPGPDLKLNFGTTGMDAGQAAESFLPIRPGDVLRVTTKVKDVYAKTGRSGTMVFTVYEETFYDHQGRKVAAVTRSGVRR